MSELDFDVAVVGAGIAGLVAARDVGAGGASVVVLEARDRVGGRLLNGSIGASAITELGGQWIGPGQDRVAALVRDLGLETFPTHDEGESVLELGGRTRRYSGTIPRLGPLVLLDIALARTRLERLMRRVPADAPWRARGAERLDGRSLADWMNSGGMRTRGAREMLRVAGRTVWGAEPEEMSLLHALFYMRSAGGLDVLLDVEGGAQQDRVVGGSALLASVLAERLGEAVVLSSPVDAVIGDPAGVTIRADDRELRVRRAIVAVPPPLRAGIDFGSASEEQRRVAGRVPLGRLVKCAAVYPEPFWREDGLSGESLSDVGPVGLSFDNSPPSGVPGVLLGFVGGGEVADFSRMREKERRAAVLGCFERIFGPRAAAPELYLEQDWSRERWSAGGPTFVIGPGGWSEAGPALRAAAGPIHFAGTETATRWAGFIDGAVRSGETAASVVLTTL